MSGATTDEYGTFVGFYDVWTQNVRGDVEFYVRQALKAPRPIVELGVGTGRIAIPTAQAGQHVIGVDLSPSMLAEGRGRAEAAGVSDRLSFIEADMRSWVAPEPVELVTIPFRAFLHLMTVEDQLACLDAVKRSLVPGGRLILNTFVPDPAFVVEHARQRSFHSEYVDGRGYRCEIWVITEHEVTTQRLAVNVSVEAYDGERLVDTSESTIRLRMIYRYEMEHLLARAGFEVEALYGDFDERPLTEECREMIWVARKP